MSYQALTLTMLISAPSDVPGTDLETVTDTLSRWNFRSGRRMTTPVIMLPILWSQHSHSVYGKRPQASLNTQLVEAADFGIALFANRLGTATGDFPSGTAEEIDRLHDAGKPVSVLRNTGIPLAPSLGASAERGRLDKYLDELKENVLWFNYTSAHELTGQLENIFAERAREAATAVPGAWIDRQELERLGDDGYRLSGPTTDITIGVWPSVVSEMVEVQVKAGTMRLASRQVKQWYLVLTNLTGQPVKNVRFRYDTTNGWNPPDFDENADQHYQEKIPWLAPSADGRFKIRRTGEHSLNQVDCVVTWEYALAEDAASADGGTKHETRATVRTV